MTKILQTESPEGLRARVMALETETTVLTDELSKALKLVRRLRAREATRDHRERQKPPENGQLESDDDWVRETNKQLTLRGRL